MRDASIGVSKNVYVQDRPKSTDKSVSDYIVVSANNSIYNKETNSDGSYNLYNTTVRFTLFVRDRMSAKNFNSINIKPLNDKLLALLSVFPYNGAHTVISKPQVLTSGNDDSGFHYVMVSAELVTK